MENREAIASLKTLCNTCTMFPKCVNNKPECFQAIEMAISALEKQSRIITVTDAEGGLIASISDKDIIEENGVHVIISEE